MPDAPLAVSCELSCGGAWRGAFSTLAHQRARKVSRVASVPGALEPNRGQGVVVRQPSWVDPEIPSRVGSRRRGSKAWNPRNNGVTVRPRQRSSPRCHVLFAVVSPAGETNPLTNPSIFATWPVSTPIATWRSGHVDQVRTKNSLVTGIDVFMRERRSLAIKFASTFGQC